MHGAKLRESKSQYRHFWAQNGTCTYASWYLKGMPHAAAWRAQVVRCSTYEEFMALVDDIEHDVVACEAALAAGESVPAHPLEA